MKTRIPHSAAFVILVAAVSFQAVADDKVGWGLSGGLGVSQIKDKDGADTFQGNGVGLAADFEYRFTPNFALGFSGFSLGSAEDTFGTVDTEIEVRGFEFFGRAIFPVSDTVDVYGRVGAANYYVDIDPGSVSLDDALFGEDAVELGVGADFARKDGLAYRLEGRFFNGGKDETGFLVTIGVNYLF